MGRVRRRRQKSSPEIGGKLELRWDKGKNKERLQKKKYRGEKERWLTWRTARARPRCRDTATQLGFRTSDGGKGGWSLSKTRLSIRGDGGTTFQKVEDPVFVDWGQAVAITEDCGEDFCQEKQAGGATKTKVWFEGRREKPTLIIRRRGRKRGGLEEVQQGSST